MKAVICTVIVLMVAAPALAEQHALGKHDEFKETLLSGLRMNLTFLTPVILLSVWLARPIVGVVYQRGAFDANDLAMTASALAMYSTGLLGMGAVFLLVRAFAAKLDTKTPVKVAVVAESLVVKGLCRMYEMSGAGDLWKVEFFNDLEEARRWLGAEDD